MIAARTPTNFQGYAQDFPPRVRAILRKIRATIRKAAPDAQERISYRMPAFKLNRDIAYFAAFKHHIGFYPPVRGDAALKQAVSRYSGPKGNLQFPLDEPIPYTLIARIVKSHAKLDRANAKSPGGASK
jgi:uncharacterized protein YdhG (YjbR/CyaY superfamily)